MIKKSFAGFGHFFFGKFVITEEFGKSLIIVAVFIIKISGNAIGFSGFKLIGIKGYIISGRSFAFGVNSVGIICVKIYFFTFRNKVPFAVGTKNMEFKNIVERKRFFTVVFPIAANADLIGKTIFILGAENNIFSGFGIIRFSFRKIFATGKKNNKTKDQKNDFFQNKCVLS